MTRVGWIGTRATLIVLTFLVLLLPSRADAQFITKLYTLDYDIEADGRYSRTERYEVLATNEAAAKEIAQQAISFRDGIDDLEIVEAYTLKKDGRKLPVAASAIFLQSPTGARQEAMFSDQRQKVIVFPDVAAGDSVAYKAVKRVRQPQIPGQFTTWNVFPRTVAFNDVRQTFTAPKSMPLRVQAHEIVVEKRSRDDKVVYEWRYSGRGVVTEDLSTVSALDRAPRAFISSFKNYDELGRSYAQIALPKAIVTPNIKALADEITRGLSDRREQARRIYEWVSSQIRYVAITLGNGGLVPHDAESVMTNRYGDCKDHVVLFDALLRAKGIESEMVLINLGSSYTLSEVPTFAQLNHVITWVPEFGLYLDTTLGVAPFGTLAFEEYGKPVVHAAETGTALHRTPLLAAGTASSTVRTTIELKPDGRSEIRTTMAGTGPYSLVLRELAMKIQLAGAERSAQTNMRDRGVAGTGVYRFPSSRELASDYTLSGEFHADPRPHLMAGGSFFLMGLLWRPGDFLMGPLWLERLRDSEPTPCFSGQATEEIAIELPPGRRIGRLPESRTVSTDNLQFRSSYSFDGHTLSVHRDFIAKVQQPLCTGELRKAVARAFSEIRADYHAQAAISGE